MNPIKKPTMIGKKEISEYDGEILKVKISISAIKPMKYSSIMVPNDAVNGTQKDLLTTPPPHLMPQILKL